MKIAQALRHGSSGESEGDQASASATGAGNDPAQNFILPPSQDDGDGLVSSYGLPGSGADRRRYPRTCKLYRLIRVETQNDVGLARCRNISDGGLKFDTAMPLDVDQPVEIALAPSIRLTGRVRWRHGHECGMAFDRRVDSTALLTHAAEEVRLIGAWGLRIETQLPARLWVDGRTESTTLTDLAPRSVRLCHPKEFVPGLHVKLMLNCGKERDAVVRWSRNETTVLLLLQPFSIDDLGSVHGL